MDSLQGRRSFVVSLIVVGGGAIGVGGGQTYVRAKESLIIRLSAWLSDSEAARELGRAYLDAYPHERSADAITAALRLGLDVLPFSVTDERLRVVLHLGCSDGSSPTSPTPLPESATAFAAGSAELADPDLEPPEVPDPDPDSIPDPDLDSLPISEPDEMPPPSDSTDPVRQLACPSPIAVTSPRGWRKVIDFEVPSRTLGGAPAAAACAPGPGTRFPVGDTEVACTRTDRARDGSLCTFLVSVVEPIAITKTPSVLAFGDSITEGFLATSFSRFLSRSDYEGFWISRSHDFDATSYPTQLRGSMEERYGPEVIVVNGGRGGETAGQGAKRFVGRFQDANPDLVLLLEGVNSVTLAIVVAKNRGRSPDTAGIAEDLRSMARAAQVRGAQVLLATLTPIGDRREQETPGFRSVAQDLNRRIRDLANSIGIGPAVDLANMMSRSLISADGIHPTPEGYVRIAEIFFQAIVQRFEVPKMTSMLRPPGMPDPADGRLFVAGGSSYRAIVAPPSIPTSGQWIDQR